MLYNVRCWLVVVCCVIFSNGDGQINRKFQIQDAFRKNTRRNYIFSCRPDFYGDLETDGKFAACFNRYCRFFVRRFDVRSRFRHALETIHALEHFLLSLVSVSSVF